MVLTRALESLDCWEPMWLSCMIHFWQKSTNLGMCVQFYDTYAVNDFIQSISMCKAWMRLFVWLFTCVWGPYNLYPGCILSAIFFATCTICFMSEPTWLNVLWSQMGTHCCCQRCMWRCISSHIGWWLTRPCNWNQIDVAISKDSTGTTAAIQPLCACYCWQRWNILPIINCYLARTHNVITGIGWLNYDPWILECSLLVGCSWTFGSLALM